MAAVDTASSCDNNGSITGIWYDLSTNRAHPKPFTIQQVAGQPNQFEILAPNEWNTNVTVSRKVLGALPAQPAQPASALVPTIAGHPECGGHRIPGQPAHPAIPARTQFEFDWPSPTHTTLQNLSWGRD